MLGANTTVLVSNSVISNNHCLATSTNVNVGGAGIYAGGGGTTLSGSTVDHNNSKGHGGGVYVVGANTDLTIVRSAISDNTAAVAAAGLFLQSGALAVISSTIKGNAIGGIYQYTGSLDIVNTTISGNGTGQFAGVKSESTWNRKMRNSVVVGNGNSDCTNLQSDGFNWVGGTTCLTKTTGDQDNQTASSVGLGVFADDGTAGNGHFPLLLTSSLIAAGDATACTEKIYNIDVSTDQLGKPRGNPCEVGAIAVWCGDAVLQSAKGEECDDGAKNSDIGACLSTCKKAKCGDKLVQAGVEQCDDGNQVNDDSCPNTCKLPTCGDGIFQAALQEECDEGEKNINTGNCLTTCKKAACGDGLVLAGIEECDDGNVADGDGCSAACKAEPKPEVKAADSGFASGDTMGATSEIEKTGASGAATGTTGTGGSSVDTTTPPATAGGTDSTAPSVPAAPSSGSSGGGCALIR